MSGLRYYITIRWMDSKIREIFLTIFLGGRLANCLRTRIARCAWIFWKSYCRAERCRTPHFCRRMPRFIWWRKWRCLEPIMRRFIERLPENQPPIYMHFWLILPHLCRTLHRQVQGRFSPGYCIRHIWPFFRRTCGSAVRRRGRPWHSFCSRYSWYCRRRWIPFQNPCSGTPPGRMECTAHPRNAYMLRKYMHSKHCRLPIPLHRYTFCGSTDRPPQYLCRSGLYEILWTRGIAWPPHMTAGKDQEKKYHSNILSVHYEDLLLK